ncbi:MAG: hypothetical protein HN348_04120 [Proteobacteria bacterium]|jgi:hypothetical protein|nr:hypothetical protein [Pseudomonadota bacterium]
MYNIVISLLLAIITFVTVSLLMSPIAAIFPAILVLGLALFLLTRRVSKKMEAEMAKLLPMIQGRRLKEAVEHIEDLKRRYGRWQVLLAKQLDAQLGMLQYLQMKWDPALPLLEKGRWRNWTAQVAIGCIHYRKGRKNEAWKSFTEAAGSGRKELIIYLVWATLLTRAAMRSEAMEVVNNGLVALPDNELLKKLKNNIANKRKIKVKQFPESWYQFFPEDYATQHVMRGRKGALPAHMQMQQPKMRGSTFRKH